MRTKLLAIPLFFFVFATGCKNESSQEPESTTPVTPQPSTVGSYAKGADVSWITELERYAYGKAFKDVNGNKKELMTILQEIGCNSIRLRVWVDPSNTQGGFCDKKDVVTKAKRAAALGLRVMIDFHYSDTWCDPANQSIPASWANKSIDEVCTLLAGHTKDVLQAVKDAGVTPEWVQVGNETHTGMCWPLGQINDNSNTEAWANYGKMVAAGYDAVKEVLPDAQVIVHFASAYKDYSSIYKTLKENGGKWDIIGLSHYPMDIKNVTWKNANTSALNNIKKYHQTFNCPVMIVEIGTKAADDQIDTAIEAMADIREKTDPLDYFQGIFYWEPEIYYYKAKGWYWHGYEMGAFTSEAKPNNALIELWK